MPTTIDPTKCSHYFHYQEFEEGLCCYWHDETCIEPCNPSRCPKPPSTFIQPPPAPKPPTPPTPAKPVMTPEQAQLIGQFRATVVMLIVVIALCLCTWLWLLIGTGVMCLGIFSGSAATDRRRAKKLW